MCGKTTEANRGHPYDRFITYSRVRYAILSLYTDEFEDRTVRSNEPHAPLYECTGTCVHVIFIKYVLQIFGFFIMSVSCTRTCHSTRVRAQQRCVQYGRGREVGGGCMGNWGCSGGAGERWEGAPWAGRGAQWGDGREVGGG